MPHPFPDGRWTNQTGSVLTLDVRENGGVTGVFRAASDGVSYRPRRLLGRLRPRSDGHPGIVATVLGWPRAESLTVLWAEYDEVADELEATWLATVDAGSPARGQETFQRDERAAQLRSA